MTNVGVNQDVMCIFELYLDHLCKLKAFKIIWAHILYRMT